MFHLFITVLYTGSSSYSFDWGGGRWLGYCKWPLYTKLNLQRIWQFWLKLYIFFVLSHKFGLFTVKKEILRGLNYKIRDLFTQNYKCSRIVYWRCTGGFRWFINFKVDNSEWILHFVPLWQFLNLVRLIEQFFIKPQNQHKTLKLSVHSEFAQKLTTEVQSEFQVRTFWHIYRTSNGNVVWRISIFETLSHDIPQEYSKICCSPWSLITSLER